MIINLDTAYYSKLSNCVPGLLTQYDIHVSQLAPCNHEESDTRLMFHLYSATKEGYAHSCIYITTVDMDVVVLAIYFVS